MELMMRKNDTLTVRVIDGNLEGAIKKLRAATTTGRIFATLKSRKENPNRNDRLKAKKRKAEKILEKKKKKKR
jgi:ribosomal protein S21